MAPLLLAALLAALAAPAAASLAEAKQLAADGWFPEAQAAFLHAGEDPAALLGAATLAILLDADLDQAATLRQHAASQAPTMQPPLAMMHRDEHVMFHGLGSALWMAALPYERGSDGSLHVSVGSALDAAGEHGAAARHLLRAAELGHVNGEVQLYAQMLAPRVFESEEEAAWWHRDMVTGLRRLSRTATRMEEGQFQGQPAASAAVAHLGAESDRELTTLAARAAIRLNPFLLLTSSLLENGPVPLRHNRPLRVGFVSKHFSHSTECRLLCGVMRGLDRERFEVLVFNPQEQHDRFTNVALGAGAEHVRMPVTLDSRPEAMARDLDVLVFVDLDADLRLWGFGRMAPVQVAVWSPSTSGLPNMDYFVTGDAMAPALDADDRFSEQLVRLDGLGAFVFQTPRKDPLPHRLPAGLSPADRFVALPDGIDHLHPSFDAALEALLRGDASLKVVVCYRKVLWLRPLQRRLRKRLSEDEFARLVPVRNLQQGAVRDAVIGLAAAVLDPAPWGSDAAALDATFHCTPLVAVAGRVPSLAVGLVREMGVEEHLLAADAAEAAQLALALAQAPELRRAVSQQMCERNSAVVQSEAAVRSWEAFLERAAVQSSL